MVKTQNSLSEMMEFTEKQKFRQWWLWVILVGVLVVPVAMTLATTKTGDKDFMTNLLVGATVPVFILFLFVAMELRVQINQAGIFYRFFPLHLRVFSIEWDEVEKAYVRQYSPISEYGGWGIRFGLGGKGKAYNVSGNIGLQVELKNGKKILFGTQKPDEIKELLNQLVKAKVLKGDAIKG